VLCLFDFDGVLADSLPLYEGMVRICLERLGHSFLRDRRDFLDLFEANFYESIAKRGVDVERFNEEIGKILPGTDFRKITAVPGMEAVLRALREKDARCVVISSSSSRAIEAVLEREGWTGLFEEVLGADFLLEKVAKIRHAVARWRRDGEPVFFIGDTAGDIREARAAGVKTVAVTWGWHSEERLRAAGPDLLVHSPGELPALPDR
jgi:phosphoglycolate phosphatase